MSNALATARRRTAFPLGLRESIIRDFPAREDAIPDRPARLHVLLGEQAARSDAISSDALTDTLGSDEGRAVLELRDTLFVAPGRERECVNLWNESLATMLYATELARLVDQPTKTAGCAGLLHRAGEACALRAIAATEAEALLRIDDPTRSDLCGRHHAEFSARLAQSWRLPEPVTSAITAWRRFGDASEFSRLAATVYFSHLLAVELLHPEFCAPGLVQTVSRELGVDRAHLDAIRLHDGTIRSLIDSLGAATC